MGISKEEFKDRDIFILYELEGVMFRYECKTNRFFCKFLRRPHEREVRYDDRLLNDAMRFGNEIDAAAYHAPTP